MHKCLLIANCQVGPISKLLKHSESFISRYELEALPPAHTWSKAFIQSLPQKISDCDMVISQPLLSDNFGYAAHGALKKQSIPTLFFPVAFFEGYFPTIVHLKNFNQIEHKGVPMAQCGLPLFFYFNNYSLGQAVNEYYLYLERDDIDFHKLCQKSIHGLKDREDKLGLDVRISSFIEEKYRTHKLMHSLNHPTNLFFFHIVNSILSLLGLGPVDERYICDEMLGGVQFPLFPNVKKSLQIEFDDEVFFKIHEKYYSIPQYIVFLYEFYNKNKALGELNYDFNKDKLIQLFNPSCE